MLQITPAQMDALEEIQIKRLRDDIIKHLHENFEENIEQVDREQLLQFVYDSIKEARTYGIEIEEDAYVFINVKVVLKIYCPYDNEEHGWVVNTLTNKEVGSPSDRLENLCKLVDAYLNQQNT